MGFGEENRALSETVYAVVRYSTHFSDMGSSGSRLLPKRSRWTVQLTAPSRPVAACQVNGDDAQLHS